MAVRAICLVVFLAMTGFSNASYCLCINGLPRETLQANIDYACRNGADCTAIHKNGPCFNPNTAQDHCNYAVNSYYHKKWQVPGSCDFANSAAIASSPPLGQSSSCVYPSSANSDIIPSTGGTGTTGGTTGGTTRGPRGGT